MIDLGAFMVGKTWSNMCICVWRRETVPPPLLSDTQILHVPVQGVFYFALSMYC